MEQVHCVRARGLRATSIRTAPQWHEAVSIVLCEIAPQLLDGLQLAVGNDGMVQMRGTTRLLQACYVRRPESPIAVRPPRNDVHALVEENVQETAAIARSFASSRKAMICSRVTEGKPSRKSSILRSSEKQHPYPHWKEHQTHSQHY